MAQEPDVLCFSHLRWNFVYQRPQHLLGRCARQRRVFFIEEPISDRASEASLELETTREGVTVCVPHLPRDAGAPDNDAQLRRLLDTLIEREAIAKPVLWYYTPMALTFSHHVRARAVVYDCMDELSQFKDAPAGLTTREELLLSNADVVFTGGYSLYEHKRGRHRNLHPFPSSVDTTHFARARALTIDPVDQATIPRPRVGFFGVIDERMDLALLDQLAAARPDLSLVMLGPVVKIDPANLPQRPNIHWLGNKSYAELPDYLAGWDVAMLPFARNPSTQFISPTKTPEYLAAGCPVVSTSIRDVVRPYGEHGLVWIADTAAAFSCAIDNALAEDPDLRRARADEFLNEMSWDRTWSEMWRLVDATIFARSRRAAVPIRSSRGAGGSMTTWMARREREG